MELFYDNKSAIYNPVFYEKTKHIEVDYHVVRDKFKEGVIKPTLVKIEYQVTDLFTKTLWSHRLQFLTSSLSVYNIYKKSKWNGGCC